MMSPGWFADDMLSGSCHFFDLDFFRTTQNCAILNIFVTLTINIS